MNQRSSGTQFESPGRRSQYVYVAAILCVALLLRLYRLSGQSIWVDEMLTLSSSGITAPLSPIDIFDNLHGPLHSLLLFFWTKLAGQGEFALRLPSVIFSVLSLLAIYKLILRLCGSRTAAIALALMAISPFHVWYAQEVRNYSMLLFFSALSFDSFLQLLSEPERKTFGKYILFTFAALLCNMSAFLAIVVQDIVFLFWPRKLSFRNLVFAQLLIVLLLGPWLSGMFERVEFHRLVRTEPYSQTELLRGETTFSPFAIPYTFFTFSVGYTLGPSLRELHESTRLAGTAQHLPVLLSAATAFSLAFLLGIVSLRNRRRLALFLLVWIVVPLAVISLFAVKNFKPFNPRYVMIAFPAYVVLIAEGIGSARWRWVRLAVAAVLAAAMCVSLLNHYYSPAYAKDDFRTAARVLDSQVRPRDVIFTEGTFEPFVYYSKNSAGMLHLWPEIIAEESRLRAFVLEKTSEAGRVWLVTSRLWDLDPEGRVAAAFRELFDFQREFTFEGVQVTLFTGKEASSPTNTARED